MDNFIFDRGGWVGSPPHAIEDEAVCGTSPSAGYIFSDGDRCGRDFWGSGSSFVKSAGQVGDVIGVYFDTTNDFIGFTKNGKPLGIAFKDFIAAKHTYYFAVSISTEATVRINHVCSLPAHYGNPASWNYPEPKFPS